MYGDVRPRFFRGSVERILERHRLQRNSPLFVVVPARIEFLCVRKLPGIQAARSHICMGDRARRRYHIYLRPLRWCLNQVCSLISADSVDRVPGPSGRRPDSDESRSGPEIVIVPE